MVTSRSSASPARTEGVGDRDLPTAADAVGFGALRASDQAAPAFREIARRAATFFERLEATASAAGNEETGKTSDGLASRLAGWARVVGGGDRERLERRLHWDGIDPARAAAALGAGGDVLPQAVAWTETLASAIAEGRRSSAQSRRAAAIDHLGPTVEEIPFLELWLPWLDVARASLITLIGPHPSGLAASARADLERSLVRELATCGEAAAYERFELLRREEPEGCLARFLAAALHDPLTVLYQAHPVLARQLTTLVEQWTGRTAELWRRLARDRGRLAPLLGAATADELGDVVAVESGLSDRHAGGRTVHRLRFASGSEIVYKPRSVAAEGLLARVAAWCRERGLEEAPATVAVVEGEGYGWMEVAARARLEARELDAWFRRAGALLSIAHCLRARDLHAENVVATAQGPAIIDAEMLLQPVVQRLTSGDVEEVEIASGPCLATGLLTGVRPDGEVDDELGGLRVSRPRGRERVWEAVGTDAMTVRLEDVVGAPRLNCPLVGETPTGPEGHQEAIAAGFERTARLLVARRPELLGDSGPLAGADGIEVRVLIRPSQAYGRVLQLASLPRNQRSGLARSWLAEALLAPWTEGDSPPPWWPRAAEERRSLERGDVPRFVVAAGDTALGSAEHATAFASSGLDAVRRRIEALDEPEIRRQVALIRAVFDRPAPRTSGASHGDAPDRRRDAGLGIVRHLAAEFRGDRLTAGLDLTDGFLGPLLALAAAARVDGDLRPDLDRAIDRGVEIATAEDLHRARGPGAFSGHGAAVWGLCQAFRLHPDPRLLATARARAEGLSPPSRPSASGEPLDLDRGAAGAILALLCLAETAGEVRWIEAARGWGELLLRAQRPSASGAAAWPNAAGLFQSGWAHGAAGIVRSLAALSRATGDARFLVAATAGIAHERGWFDRERGNWPVLLTDGRGDGTHRDRLWMVACCRGAPGIALSRLHLPASLRDDALLEERAVALRTTADAEPGLLDTLCCGTLGRASVLLSASRRLAGSANAEQLLAGALRLTDGALERARRRGAFVLDGSPWGRLLPRTGLLKGLSGVAWHLLRIDDPALPDVVALELPSEGSGDRR